MCVPTSSEAVFCKEFWLDSREVMHIGKLVRTNQKIHLRPRQLYIGKRKIIDRSNSRSSTILDIFFNLDISRLGNILLPSLSSKFLYENQESQKGDFCPKYLILMKR